jgi:tRNA A37 N6-isopentenylltransferase MiaA
LWGTGLYINTLLYNIDFSETVCDWELRDRLKKEAQEMEMIIFMKSSRVLIPLLLKGFIKMM